MFTISEHPFLMWLVSIYVLQIQLVTSMIRVRIEIVEKS